MKTYLIVALALLMMSCNREDSTTTTIVDFKSTYPAGQGYLKGTMQQTGDGPITHNSTGVATTVTKSGTKITLKGLPGGNWQTYLVLDNITQKGTYNFGKGTNYSAFVEWGSWFLNASTPASEANGTITVTDIGPNAMKGTFTAKNISYMAQGNANNMATVTAGEFEMSW